MKKGIIVVVVLLVVGVLGAVIGMPLYHLHFKTIDMEDGQKIIYVPSGSNLDQLGTQVESEGIHSKNEFLEFAEKLDFTDAKVEAGKYIVEGGMKVKTLIYALKNGNQEVKDARITFNNCKDIYEMAGKVAPDIEADSAAIVDYILKPETIEHYGFSDETIIALFLPDTYEVGEWDLNAEEFVSFMADEFNSFWNEQENGSRKTKLDDLGLQQSEVVTLASILEAEQGLIQSEWPRIAGLYLNRVRDGWKLQSDPTAKYCWGDELVGVQRLLNVHMQKDCPYNTYLYPGLPPGPIRMPSKEAIDAVLNAEDHNYYYMCASPVNDGTHNFAQTLSQHLKNANAWYEFMNSRGY